MSVAPSAELYEASQRSRLRIHAENSPFEMKDHLKARGYRWPDGSDTLPKSWWIELPEERLDDELHFLRTRSIDGMPIRWSGISRRLIGSGARETRSKDNHPRDRRSLDRNTAERYRAGRTPPWFAEIVRVKWRHHPGGVASDRCSAPVFAPVDAKADRNYVLSNGRDPARRDRSTSLRPTDRPCARAQACDGF